MFSGMFFNMSSILILAQSGFNSISDGISSVLSSVTSNPITTIIGPLISNIEVGKVGQAAASLTGGVVQLNNIVPQPVRSALRVNLGRPIGRLNGLASGMIAGALRVNDNEIIRSVIAAPVVEELIYRLPLLMASKSIDLLTSEFITSPLLEGVIDMTGGTAVKVGLAAITSIAFTYLHGKNPSPGRALGLFTGSMTLSHLTLRPTGGLANSMVAHAIHNLLITAKNYCASKLV